MKLTALLSLFAITLLPVTAQEPPKAGPEHQKLAAMVGTWDCVVESVGPDGQASTSKGTSEQRLLQGSLWLIDDFTGDFGGMSFQGHGVSGFDPAKGKYVTTWVDGWTPSLLLLEGNYDKTGLVLTMTGMGVGMDGKPAKYRNVTTWKDANTYVFEMFMTGADSKEMGALKITYTRREAKAGGVKDQNR